MEINCEQRSEQWFRLRIEKITSTRLKVLGRGTIAAKNKLLEAFEFERDYPEIALDKAMEQFGDHVPSAIRLGREREDWLIARYEIARKKENKNFAIRRPGIVIHDALPNFASRPDWMAHGRAGEGKTRTDQTKHEYAIRHGVLPEDKDQCYCHMMCGNVIKCDYVSYCPTWDDPATSVHIIELDYDPAYGNQLYARLQEFFNHHRDGTRYSEKVADDAIPSFF